MFKKLFNLCFNFLFISSILTNCRSKNNDNNKNNSVRVEENRINKNRVRANKNKRAGKSIDSIDTNVIIEDLINNNSIDAFKDALKSIKGFEYKMGDVYALLNKISQNTTWESIPKEKKQSYLNEITKVINEECEGTRGYNSEIAEETAENILLD